MRRLNSFPAASTSRYPWNELLDGSTWELVHGDDFTAKPTTFVANARAQAKRRGGTLRTRLFATDDRTTVVIQYVGGAA